MTLLLYMLSALVFLSIEVLGEAARPKTSCFKIDLSHRVPHMVDMIKRTELPSSELEIAINSRNDSTNTGISLSKLGSLRSQWLYDFDWEKEQLELNQYEMPYNNPMMINRLLICSLKVDTLCHNHRRPNNSFYLRSLPSAKFYSAHPTSRLARIVV